MQTIARITREKADEMLKDAEWCRDGRVRDSEWFGGRTRVAYYDDGAIRVRYRWKYAECEGVDSDDLPLDADHIEWIETDGHRYLVVG